MQLLADVEKGIAFILGQRGRRKGSFWYLASWSCAPHPFGKHGNSTECRVRGVRWPFTFENCGNVEISLRTSK